MTLLTELQGAHDWRGVVTLKKEALALARELQGETPAAASAGLAFGRPGSTREKERKIRRREGEMERGGREEAE